MMWKFISPVVVSSRLKNIADQKELFSSLESMSSESSESETDTDSETASSGEDDGVMGNRRSSSFIGRKRRKNRSGAGGSRAGGNLLHDTRYR